MLPTPVKLTTQNTSQLTSQPQHTSQLHTTLKTDVVKFSSNPALISLLKIKMLCFSESETMCISVFCYLLNFELCV